MIHPTAIISPKAELASGVEVGAYAIVEEGVRIGAKTKLHPHSYVRGNTKIGTACQIFSFASVGMEPQDLKFQNEDSRTIIGDRTTIREHASVHGGTTSGGMETRIGDDCFIMANACVSHDCILGNNIILANGVLLAGHCDIGDHVFMGGNAVMQQFLKIGAHAFIAGFTGLAGHVPPYVSVFGIPGVWTGINVVGLKRRGFDKAQMQGIRKFYKDFYALDGTTQVRLEKMKSSGDSAEDTSGAETKAITAFIEGCLDSPHGLVQGRR